MKVIKRSISVLVLSTIIILSACQQKTLKNTVNLSDDEIKNIENIFLENDVQYDRIDPVTISEMNKRFKAYGLYQQADEEEKYILIIDTEDKIFEALLDSNHYLLYGYIDNTMFPEWGEERNPVY